MFRWIIILSETNPLPELCYHNICLSHSFTGNVWSLWFFVRVPFHYNSGTHSLVDKVIVYVKKIQG